MTPTQRLEEKLDEELYFLSQDGYAVGWRETKKKDILDILLSELSLQKQKLAEKVERLPTLNTKNAKIEVRGIPLADKLISKESTLALINES